MAVQKRSISFDENVLAEAERLSQERGGNLSAFVNEAVEQRLKIALGRKLMEEDEKRWGPIPEEAIAEIEALWPD
jgi:metal-responsive CopG/Arc/MetJ family transcriptional regulator